MVSNELTPASALTELALAEPDPAPMGHPGYSGRTPRLGVEFRATAVCNLSYSPLFCNPTTVPPVSDIQSCTIAEIMRWKRVAFYDFYEFWSQRRFPQPVRKWHSSSCDLRGDEKNKDRSR